MKFIRISAGANQEYADALRKFLIVKYNFGDPKINQYKEGNEIKDIEICIPTYEKGKAYLSASKIIINDCETFRLAYNKGFEAGKREGNESCFDE